MKNLFCRLTQATADATVTQHFGIYQNCSPNADTPTGYTVSKNQNSKKFGRLPKLAAVMLLLLFTTGIYKLNAQAPTVTNPFVTLTSSGGYRDMAIDAAGNMYVTVNNFKRIDKITPSGVLTTGWVTLSAAPRRIVVDASGNVYTANANFTISKITSAGVVTNQWVLFSVPTGGSWTFADMTIDASGNFYLVNGLKTVSKITPDGTLTQNWATINAVDTYLTSIKADNTGNVYAGSYKLIHKISSTGVVTESWADVGGISEITSMTFDANGNLYTANRNSNTVSKITPAGIVTETFATLQQDTDPFLQDGALPLDITLDQANGSLYTANFQVSTISKIAIADGTTNQNWITGTTYPRRFAWAGSNLFVFSNQTQNIVKLAFPTVTFNQTLPSCVGAMDGGLRAIPPTTCPTGYQYLWTPGGATTDTISNLAPGTYSVRVVCGTDTVNKSITLTAATVVAAPSTSNQSLCNGATVADLVATPAAGNTIVWYATATGGTPLASSTPLVNATKYYAAQVTPSNCESNTRAVDSVTIRATVAAKADSSYCNGSNIAVNFVGASGNTYTWTATQNGTGIAASGTGNTSFTGTNNTNAVVKDTVIVTSSYNSTAGYTISDGTYAFADTTGSTYLSISSLFTTGGNSNAIPVGFDFKFFGTNFSNIFLSTNGLVAFDAARTKVIEGQRRTQSGVDGSSKIAYKTTGSAPNRKFIISFIEFTKPNNTSTGGGPFGGPTFSTTYTADPVAGKGTYQVVLNETSNIIESLKQSVPSLTAFSIPIGTGPAGNVIGNYEGVKDGSNEFYVAGRKNGEWLKLTNESKLFIPSAILNCTPQKDTFAISVLPTPKVDSIANMQVCPGSTAPAINFTTPITGGTVGYKWSNSNTTIGLAASGFGNIPSFTAAATAQTSTISVRPYMLKSATDTCFGTVRTFVINADLLPAPTTVSSIVAYTGTKTISQLAVTPLAGGSLNYFYQATGGTALAGSTIVVDDTTYYVTQTLAGCESNPRKQIKVNRIAADSIVLCSPATVGSLIATPTTGSSAKWYDVPSGGTALANTAALALGQDTLYVEEGNPSAQLSLHSYSPTDLSYAINGLTVGENDTIYYGTFGDNAKIIRINPDGSNPTIITSGGPGENIRYVQYESDASGRYILYTTQNTVKRLNLNTGVITTIWTSPTPASFNLREFSRDVANNKLYVADTEFGRIKLVDLANNTAVTIDSLPYKQFGTSSFPRRPFAVCYVAPNSLYIGDFTNGLVFKKDLTTGIRTDSISYPSITDIRLLSNGKLMIIGGGKISTINQDLTGRTDIVTSLISGGYAEFNSQGELVFKDYLTIKKLSSIQSNRVPVTVIVNPKPIVTATIDKVVCNNSTVAAVNFSTTTTGGTVTYAWTNNKTSIGLAASGTGDITSFTAINNGTAPDTATIIVTPTIINGGTSCAGIKDTFLIIVNPTAVVNAVSDKVVCNGSAVTAINFGTTNTGGTVAYAWTNNTTSISLAANGTGNIATFNGVNTGTAPVTATIVVTPTFTNGGVSCTGTSQTFTITVNPTVTVNPENDQVVCNGAGSTAINFSTTATGGTTTYTWTNDKPTNGLAASGTGNIASFTAVNNGTAPDTATIIVTPTITMAGVSCAGVKDTFLIIVNPSAKIDPIADKAACNGSTVATTMPTSTATGGTVTYTWTNNTTSIGLAASGTGNIPSFTATNTGSTAITSTIIVTPTFTNGGVSCVGTNDTFNITVNPPPIFAATADKYVCNASTTTAVVFTTALTGGTAVYHWTNSNTAIGLAATGTGNVPSVTATNNTTAPIMGSIVVYMDYTNAGLTCTSLKDTFSYVVNPTAVVNPVNDQVLCNGSTTAAINFSTTASGGITTYAWTNDKPGIGLAATGTGNIAAFTAVNNSATPDTATIIVTPTFANGGTSCQGTKDTIYIVVNPTANVNTISNQVVCNGAAVTAINFGTTNTGGTVSYTWTNNTTSIGLVASGTSNIATFNGVNTGIAPVTATIVVTPTFTNGGVSCTGTSQTFTITVNPTVNINALNDHVLCNGASFAEVAPTTTATGGTVTYAWTNNNTSIGLAASVTGNIPAFSSVNSGTAPVTATVIVTPTFANGGVDCAGTADTFYITVNPTATVNVINNQTVCNGAAVAVVTPTTTATGGTVTYAWTNDNASIGLAASGTGSIPAFTAINTGSAPVTATITVTPTFTNDGLSCTGTVRTYTITINPTATVNTVSNQVVCNGSAVAAVNFSITATGGTVTYSWTNSNTTIGLSANGSGNIASFTATNNGTAPVTATITVTPTFTNDGVSCQGTAQAFTITVNPTAVVNTVTNKVVCNGSSIAAINFGTTATGGSIVYNWTNNNTSIGLAATGTGNIASFNAINNTNASQTAIITVTPVFTNGGVSCTGTAMNFTITVNPEMIVNAISSQVLCNNASTTAVNFASPTTGGTIVYNWTNSNTAIGLGANGTGNIASFTATNSSNAPISGTITVIATYTNAGISCASAPQTFVYSVNPTATVNAINNQAVCTGAAVSAVNFATSATGGTVTYAWTNSNSSIGLAVSGTGNIASFTATNSSHLPVTATITVTPIFTNGGVSCTGTAQSFTVTVNQTAVVNAVSNQTVCAGSTNSAVTFSSPVAGTTYSWTNSNPSIGLAASGTGNVPSFVAVNPSPNAINATITVTPNTSAGCIGQSITYAITVNGLSVAPTAIINPTPIVCANNAFTTLSVNGGALGSGAVWKWYADSLNTVSIGSGATLSNIPVAKTTTYFVRAEGTCNNTAAATVVVQRANLVSHVRQHWSDVLLFDNSSRNFVAWQWYKNGVAVNGATLQQYSESIPLVGTYYVVATDKNGEKTITCPLTITAGSFTGLKISLFPNPADKGANVTIATSFSASELQGATIIISDIYGRVIRQITQVSPNTAIQAPAATGIYVVTLTLQNGVKYSSNLLTK